ncbi:MAG TPA: AAA family ATPase, partial [Enhygromyxa sp.]|nr:AAA family ATPase [Enhygromyxa sp.]
EYRGTSKSSSRRLDDDDDEPSWDGDIEYEADDSVRVFKGMQVRHPKFGVGSVVSWSGSGENMKLTASFAVGRKTIMARFCELL